MTYDNDRTWRPRPSQETGSWRPGADDPNPNQPDDADSAQPDPDDLTTQVAVSPDDPEPLDDLSGEPFDTEEAAIAAASDESDLDPDADPDTTPFPDDPAAPSATGRGRRGRKPKVTGADPGLAIFVDSSAIIALVDRDDNTHAAAVAAYGNLLAEGYKLFTTNYVISETFDLLSTGVGPDVARRFLRDCKLAIYHADEQDERRAKRVVLRQTGPNGLTLTDAVSFVVMERLNVADAFAVDPGFLSNAT